MPMPKFRVTIAFFDKDGRTITKGARTYVVDAETVHEAQEQALDRHAAAVPSQEQWVQSSSETRHEVA
jgi:hypothetical protein